MKNFFYMLVFCTTFFAYTAQEDKEQQEPRGRSDRSLKRRSSRSSSSPSNPVVQLIVVKRKSSGERLESVVRKSSSEKLERPTLKKKPSSSNVKRLSSGSLKLSGDLNFDGKFLEEENLELNKDGRLSPRSGKNDVVLTANVTQLATIKENGDASPL